MERLTGWGVVALWGTFNAFFVLLLVGFLLGGYGRSVFAVETYAAAVGLVFAFAFAVWLGRRRHTGPGAATRSRLAGHYRGSRRRPALACRLW